MTVIHDGDPCKCGSRSYNITATLIGCRGCPRVWGRVNGLWVLDPDSEPPTKGWGIVAGEDGEPVFGEYEIEKETNA